MTKYVNIVRCFVLENMSSVYVYYLYNVDIADVRVTLSLQYWYLNGVNNCYRLGFV